MIDQAKDRLIELIDLVDVKTTIDGAYSGIPEGKFGLHQAWSGDIQAGPFYADDPKTDSPLFRYYWPARDGFGGTIDNDMYAIPKNAKNPVLAHLFLDYMMDNFNALKNWSWLGYQVPFNVVDRTRSSRRAIRARGLVRLGLREAPPGKHWDNLKPTIVTEKDIKIGKRDRSRGRRRLVAAGRVLGLQGGRVTSRGWRSPRVGMSSARWWTC